MSETVASTSWAELRGLKISELRQRAEKVEATIGEMDTALDEDDPKSALIALILSKLKGPDVVVEHHDAGKEARNEIVAALEPVHVKIDSLPQKSFMLGDSQEDFNPWGSEGNSANWMSGYPDVAAPSEWMAYSSAITDSGLMHSSYYGMFGPPIYPVDAYMHTSISGIVNPFAVKVDEQSDIHNLSLESVQGRVWTVAKESKAGSLAIQQLLESDLPDSDGAKIASELRNHVLEAIWSPHANHLVQACIKTLRPRDVQFIIDEIMERGSVVTVAEHQYGCRILQRLLEHFPPDRLQTLIEGVLSEAIHLSKHNYGSFFMQHLLQYGDENYINRLMQSLTLHASALASDSHGVAVLEKALTLEGWQDAQESLANALAAQPRWLVAMSSWRHGHVTARLALQAAAPLQRDIALKEIQRHGDRLKNSRYGRKLLAFAETMILQLTTAPPGLGAIDDDVTERDD